MAIALAKAQGKHLGRRAGADAAKVSKVKACLDAGMSVHQTVAATGVSEFDLESIKECGAVRLDV